MESSKILVTGCAGFIGMHLCKSLLDDGRSVVGIDNINNYYDRSLKKARLKRLAAYNNFTFESVDLADFDLLIDVFNRSMPEKVVNLAAQAGVRYSLENPHEYIRTNVTGFLNILECCREKNIQGLIYASSSSVYGNNNKQPFSVQDSVNNPISIYGSTKITNELMANTYSHLYNLNTTGLRFFTVYGPWGRPDMALYIFTEKILKNQVINVFNHGQMVRDFTYIDDIINGICSAIKNNFKNELFNLGSSKSEQITKMIRIIEDSLGKKARINFVDIQPGDIQETLADIEYTTKKLNYNPKTAISAGIPKFIEWYKNYNSISI